ncbi:MAG TPA: ABC transporter substrate-binding protein [Mycobacteriales bacterium]|nr:ABC transporter substrate-binding protein [Mycobacteriales bacterium]
MRRSLIAAAALAATLAAGCGTDASTDSAAQPPAGGAADAVRIVPLNGDIAEIVYALNKGEQVVGTDISATYPADAVKKQKIGYQRSLSAEGILSLKPTLAIGTEEAGPPPVLEQIRSAGVRVEIVPVGTGVDGAATKIRAVAKLLGVEAAGEKLATDVSGAVDAARKRAATATDKPRVAFLYLRGPQTMMIGGRGSRADAMITAAGGVDTGTEAGINGYAQLTAEALAKAKPDVILVLTAGLKSVGGVDGLLKLPGVAQTPAGQARKIIDLDDLYLLGLGPRTGNALNDLVTALHPDLPTA